MLCPLNRYLVVEPILEQKKESGVLIPDDYETQSVYILVSLLKAHPESSLIPGSKLVVPSHMLEEVGFFGEKHHIVLENHVVGLFNN